MHFNQVLSSGTLGAKSDRVEFCCVMIAAVAFNARERFPAPVIEDKLHSRSQEVCVPFVAL